MNTLCETASQKKCIDFINNYEYEDYINQTEILSVENILKKENLNDIGQISMVVNAYGQKSIEYLSDQKKEIVDNYSSSAISATFIVGIGSALFHVAKYALNLSAPAKEICSAVGYFGFSKANDLASNISNKEMNKEKRAHLERKIFKINERLTIFNFRVNNIIQNHREEKLINLDKKVNQTLDELKNFTKIAQENSRDNQGSLFSSWFTR